MNNKSLSQYLAESPNIKPAEPVNEFLITAIGVSLMATACAPLFDKEFFKHIGTGVGALLGGIGSIFGLFSKKSDDKDGKDNGKGKGKDKDKDKDKDPKEVDEMTDEQKQKAAMVLNAHMLKESLKKKQKELKEKEEALKNAKDDEKEKLQKEVDEAKAAVDEAQKAHDTFVTSAFNDDGEPVSPNEFEENLKKSGLDEDAIKKLKTEAEKVKSEDFEKSIKENCSNLMSKSGEVDKEALGKIKGSIAAGMKDAKDRIAKAKEEPESNPEGENGENNDSNSDSNDSNGENGENNDSNRDSNSEQEYEITHDGKKTTIIKRPKKRGEGSTWCYKNDPEQTIAPDQARAMLKASGVKEGLTLAEWLSLYLS